MIEINGSTWLEKRTKRTLIDLLVLVLPGPILAIIACIFGIVALLPAAIIVFIIGLFIGQGSFGDYITMRSGIQGEKQVRLALRSLNLSNEYTAFFNVPFYSDKGHALDIDCILTGPAGIFVIEIKNLSGYSLRENGVWKRYRVSRSGNIYEVNMKNISGQLAGNIRFLKEYLARSVAVVPWIHGYIVSTHPVSYIAPSNQSWYKITTPDELCSLILSSIKSVKDTVAKENCLAINSAIRREVSSFFYTTIALK